jgi:hypothetical protein
MVQSRYVNAKLMNKWSFIRNLQVIASHFITRFTRCHCNSRRGKMSALVLVSLLVVTINTNHHLATTNPTLGNTYGT